MSLALAGKFLTTAPPGKPLQESLCFIPLSTLLLHLFVQELYSHRALLSFVNMNKDLGAAGSRQEAYCAPSGQPHGFLFSLSLSGAEYIPLPVCTAAYRNLLRWFKHALIRASMCLSSSTDLSKYLFPYKKQEKKWKEKYSSRLLTSIRTGANAASFYRWENRG